jgi:hypothetical protein
MEEIGFVPLELEPSLFICCKGAGFVVIWLHVDNRFAMASSSAVLEELHTVMAEDMEVKWVDKIVGINIEEVGSDIEMKQHLMVDQILEGYTRMHYPRRSTLPETPLKTNNSKAVDQTAY